ncbi:aldose epimerase family protein [Actinacidiphila bryophytorum]|uniref:Aldose 1-epimerase n=1 Tax=Actinacidiphila bryophytorum TaxID=1436133 RepID=A0A9W4H798_9ACTN|nr:aldose epimerase family protein [Actinacidiphila bryophytorum]MBM9437640.1 galactose mutarotase [Actinacidiphila bryophytorum]MBN6546231.1 galactose mutarotase [Actinacidiphila bryophytorum]CAG7655644.1 Aldose 1-epimerase [Actinacidiphila bryophytorum]
MPASPPHSSPFGHAPDGRPVECWRLESATGVAAEILTYGGTLHALHVPDTAGRSDSVVLSLPDVLSYAVSPYFGALVGRYANRIGGARFLLDGSLHRLPANDRGHTLHGGPDGFHHRLWEAQPLPGALRLTLHSPDGDMGFPGALDVSATYALGEDGTLALDFEARTDRTTVVNLTNHAYFNLAGTPAAGGGADASGAILRHMLRIDADGFLPVSTESIPWGPEQRVAGTPFDFTRPRALGDGLRAPDPQVKSADGYDHCWVLRKAADPAVPRTAAVLHDPDSGRTLEVRTTEPGIQVYTANQLDGTLAAPGGHRYGPHDAVCLETQHLPDSPNRREYPSAVLRPGEVLRSRTEFRFPHLTGGRS